MSSSVGLTAVIGVGKVACAHVVVYMMLQQALYLHWVCYACMYKLLDFSYELRVHPL